MHTDAWKTAINLSTTTLGHKISIAF